MTRTAARTHILKLSEQSLVEADAILERLFEGLEARTTDADAVQELGLDMRYAGQEHTLTVGLGAQPAGVAGLGVDALAENFTESYKRTFGHAMDEEIELVSARATLRTPLPRRSETFSIGRANGQSSSDSVRGYSFTQRDWLDFDVVDRQSLSAGSELAGPAIVLENTATTYVDADFSLAVDASGCLFLEGGAS